MYSNPYTSASSSSTNTSLNTSTNTSVSSSPKPRPPLPRMMSAHSAFSPLNRHKLKTYNFHKSENKNLNHTSSHSRTQKPDFQLKRPRAKFLKKSKSYRTALDMHDNDKLLISNGPTNIDLNNGYHSNPSSFDESDIFSQMGMDNDMDTDTDVSSIGDALKNVGIAGFNGYLSDNVGYGTAAYNKKHHKNKGDVNRKYTKKPPQISTNVSTEYQNYKKPKLNKQKERYKARKKKYKNKDIAHKRHSVGPTDSSTLNSLKSRYSKQQKQQKNDVKFHRAISIETDVSKKKKMEKRRRSLYNNGSKSDKQLIATPIDPNSHNNTAFSTINSAKWNIKKLLTIESESQFSSELSAHSKEDIIELCFDLLRSKDKSDDLLRMVSSMNSNLDPEKAYDTMMKTIKSTLDCRFASLFAVEEESTYLKCVWTSEGEPSKNIFIPITSRTHLAARVYQKNDNVLRSLTENNDSICPDYDGFGNVYIVGVPIYDHHGHAHNEKMGVLMIYRDRSLSDMFDDGDLHSAQIITSIAANTLKNVSLFNAAHEKEKQSQKVLSIIDEMSGDVSEGYAKIISKLVVKIRSLVTCMRIDFWTVDFGKNALKCEVSHNDKLHNRIIDRSSNHIIGQCALSGKYIKIDNVRLDTRYNAEQLQYCNGDSILIIPVRVESEMEPIAVIVALNKVAKHTQKTQCIPFNNEDRRMLETFATSASILIKNSLLFQKIAGLNRKHESMVSILRALQEKNNVTHMLSSATLAVRDALEAERVSLWFEDGQGNFDALNVGDEDEKKFEENDAIQSVFQAIVRYCAEDTMLINTPNVFEDEQLLSDIRDFIDIEGINALDEKHWFLNRECSVLCVPILSNDSVVGVIQAIYKQNVFNGFSETDQQIVESVSSEVAHTIARNINDLTLAKYVDQHDDIPLDVIDYYLTGSLNVTSSNRRRSQIQIDKESEYFLSDFKEQQQIIHDEQPNNANLYSVISLNDKLKSYCQILPTCDFDATQFDVSSDLEEFVLFALDEYGLIKEFNLNVSKLQKFTHSVAKLYKSNPFHNWQHGFFVFHFVLYFIKKQTNICNILSKKEIFAILIAAMCHDIDHPGNDNLYEIEAETDLARIYNGLAVLENHHTYTTLALLRKKEFDFFAGSNLNKKDVKEIKNVIVKAIMGTDMGQHHGEAIGWLNDFVSDKVIESFSENKENKKSEIKLKVCQCIVHMGDLSAQTYPWRIAKEWERRIAREFKQQTIKEIKQDIPVRDWMAKTDLSTRYKNQFFFVTHVVKPLWEPAVAVFPQIKERLTTLVSNSQKYMQIAKKKEENKESTTQK